MRVLITGSSGFAGTWLKRELQSAGDDVVELSAQIDVRDFDQVAAAVQESRADAIAHLAAIAFAPDATDDPGTAYSVAVRGTANVMEAARICRVQPAVLVVGSSEVYGPPRPEDIPLIEVTALRATTAYGLAKLAQESVALAYGRRFAVKTVVTRSFNHIGPGQRPDFVVPALANRIHHAVTTGAHAIPVGNVEVRRDFSDVRDVVRAYRLLVHTMLDGGLGDDPVAVNVCSGKSVSIRTIAETIFGLARVDLGLDIRPELVRPDDPPEIRGDYSLLAKLTGWRPTFALEDSLRAVWASTGASDAPESRRPGPSERGRS